MRHSSTQRHPGPKLELFACACLSEPALVLAPPTLRQAGFGCTADRKGAYVSAMQLENTKSGKPTAALRHPSPRCPAELVLRPAKLARRRPPPKNLSGSRTPPEADPMWKATAH